MFNRSRRRSCQFSSPSTYKLFQYKVEMPRTKIGKRTRQQLRLDAEREEQLRMAQMKLESALEKIDELGKRSVQQVNNQLQLILARTHQHVLQMKWSEFLKLKLHHFEDYQWIG